MVLIVIRSFRSSVIVKCFTGTCLFYQRLSGRALPPPLPSGDTAFAAPVDDLAPPLLTAGVRVTGPGGSELSAWLSLPAVVGITIAVVLAVLLPVLIWACCRCYKQ
jgi:hypothetical protein